MLFADIKQQLGRLKSFSVCRGDIPAKQRLGLYAPFKLDLSLKFILRKTWEISGFCGCIAA